MKTWRELAGPHWRPFTVLAACILLLAALDAGQGAFLSAATAYSTLQIFATVSLVTLGLGLTMMIREFDLSVVGMYGMAGCIAVLTGTQHPWLGFFLALAIGLAAGTAQGFIIVRLNVSSVGVTLGGLLIFVGIAFVLTESRSLPYDNLAVALMLNERFGGIFSIRSVVALAFFASAAVIFAWTRLGRDIIAIGSDRRAAMTTGVKVDVLIIGIFAFSGLCAALSGVLLSYPGCPLPSLRNLSSERKSACKCLQRCKASRSTKAFKPMRASIPQPLPNGKTRVALATCSPRKGMQN